MFTNLYEEVLKSERMQSKLSGKCLDIQDEINSIVDLPLTIKDICEEYNYPIPNRVEICTDEEYDKHGSYTFLSCVNAIYNSEDAPDDELLSEIEDRLKAIINGNFSPTDWVNNPVVYIK